MNVLLRLLLHKAFPWAIYPQAFFMIQDRDLSYTEVTLGRRGTLYESYVRFLVIVCHCDALVDTGPSACHNEQDHRNCIYSYRRDRLSPIVACEGRLHRGCSLAWNAEVV